MLTHPTLELLRKLKLIGMETACSELLGNPEAEQLNHMEWLALLLDREDIERKNKRFQNRLRSAKLRFSQACLEDVNHKAPRGLDRALFSNLACGHWIEKNLGLVITGPSGVGKSWLACALAHQACRNDTPTLYLRVSRMFDDLELGRGDGRYPRIMRAIAKAKLLILDDWGLANFTPSQARDMLEIVEERYDNGAILIAAQRPVDQWHGIIGDPTIADAILDRVLHRAHRIELDGDSLRKTELV